MGKGHRRARQPLVEVLSTIEEDDDVVVVRLVVESGHLLPSASHWNAFMRLLYVLV